jgi:hypothetical protein
MPAAFLPENAPSAGRIVRFPTTAADHSEGPRDRQVHLGAERDTTLRVVKDDAERRATFVRL